jgi:hypothetical protein
MTAEAVTAPANDAVTLPKAAPTGAGAVDA